MAKAQIDTTKEKQFFFDRSPVRRPRKSVSEFATTQIETPKKKRAKGNAYQHTKTGARSDLDGLVVRSNWEANFIRVLNLFNIHYEFEPIVFKFPPTPAGKPTSGYLPDIYLRATDEYIEIKGYLDSRGRSKLRRFKKHFPNEFAKLTVVISRTNRTNLLFFTKLGVKQILFYENISQLYANKVNWEGKQ